jgi:hypothetical protein
LSASNSMRRARARRPSTEGQTTKETPATAGYRQQHEKGNSFDAIKRRANNKSNTCNSMGATNSMDTRNSRANFRRRTCKSKGARKSMDIGNSKVTINSKDASNSRDATNEDDENIILKILFKNMGKVAQW